MGYSPRPPPPGRIIDRVIILDRKFALFPTKCKDSGIIWFRFYYLVRSDNLYSSGFRSVEDLYNILEEDYIIRKLAGTL
jgi:hypothetical protein